MKSFLVIIVFILIVGFIENSVWAAVSKTSAQSNEVESINKKVAVALDLSQKVSLRWQAVVSLKESSAVDKESAIQKMITQGDWVAKNASLELFTGIDLNKAQKWSLDLLSDKSMMVRMKALQVLERLGAKEHRNKLWSILKKDFIKRESLPVRRMASRLLYKWGSESQEQWRRLASDPDELIRKLAQTRLSELQ